MADWDKDSPELQSNLRTLILRAIDDARQRRAISSESARDWQIAMMNGLDVPSPAVVGHFRGEPELRGYNIRVGAARAVDATLVANELTQFDRRLADAIQSLDEMVERDAGPNSDQLLAILTLCAWAHGEWVRIHPLANGNGRAARLFVNSIAVRYGLPPFLRVRPRPGDAYGQVSAAAMRGAWRNAIPLFRQLLEESLSG